MVDAAAAVALSEAGFEPILTGTFPFNPSKYMEWYGIDLTKFKIITLSIGIKAFGLWTRLYAWRPAEIAVKKYRASLMFTDEQTYKPLLKYRESLSIIEYIHFPLEVVVDPKFKGTGLAYGEDPYIMERYGRFPLNMYWRIFTKMLPRYMRRNPFEDADAVLTNSKWTANVIKMVYGGEPMVLNPPIAPNTEATSSPPSVEARSRSIVMLGRFSEEKRYHWVVAEVMPKLMKQLPDARLVIFGGATTRTQISYMNRVAEMARRAGLSVDVGGSGGASVNIVPNAPRSRINSAMDSARAFLHATINEHWGIAVAEAMARGLPIVVHKSGGAWTDLAEEGLRGVGYSDADEAVQGLIRLLSDDSDFKRFSAAAMEKTKGLTMRTFIDGLRGLLAKI